MILSCETLAYQWIIAEVFHSDEVFANPTCISCITLVWVLIDTDLLKKLVLQNDALRNVYFIWFLNPFTRSVFRETILFNWIEEFN